MSFTFLIIILPYPKEKRKLFADCYIIVDIVALIPIVAEAIGRGLIKIVDVIGDGAVSVGAAFVKIGTAILDVLGELVPKIIYVAVEIIAAFLSGISAALPDIVLSALAIIAGFLEGIAMGLPAVVQAAFDLILAFINTMAEAVRLNDGDLLAAVGNLVSSIIELILSALQAVVQGIPVFGQQISDALEGAKSKVHETLAPESFYKMGEDAGSATGEGFRERSDEFVQAADDMTEAGLGELAGHEGDYENAGGTLGGALGGGLSSMSGLVEGAGKTLGISGLNGMSMTGEYGDLGEESGLSYILGLSSTEGNLSGVSTELTSTATGNLSAALGTFSTLGIDSGSNYVSGMASNNGDSGNEGSALAREATGSLSDAVGAFNDIGDDSGSTYISGLSSNENDAENAGRNLAGSIEQGLESRTDEIQNEGDKAGAGYSHSLSAQSGEARSAGTALADSAVQGAKSKKGEFTTAGENAGSGFLSGLGSLLGSIRSKASELARTALNAFRGTLDEHSPSKETEKSGENFDLGFIHGVENNANDIENAVADVAENALKTMSETRKAGEQFARDGWIDGMVKGLETGAYILQTAASEAGDSMISAFSESVLPSDLTFSVDGISSLTPVVTPVLDLDELRTNADEISSIFGKHQTIRLKNYADIVEGVSIDMAEFDADNRNIIEALKTLHSDMEELRNEVGQTQIVLDTGVLVGEMAGPMDVELGRRYDWEGRGM